MKRVFIFAIIISLLCPGINLVLAHNPFTSKPETQHKAPKPLFKSQFFVKIILWQHQLKQKMSEIVRVKKKDGGIRPLIFLMGITFLYGLIHAAGPGHGKFVAMTYVLSHKTSIMNGLLFGFFIAIFHGFSGAIGVLALYHIIQIGVSETLARVTAVTQIVSFTLITLLGLGILFKNGHTLFSRSEPKPQSSHPQASRRGLLPWAMAVGLVPCPAVLMVMLFCISMEVTVLGLILAACISLGMAATISIVVTTIILGKTKALSIVSENRIQMIEGSIGILSGSAITVFGTILLLSTINATLY